MIVLICISVLVPSIFFSVTEVKLRIKFSLFATFISRYYYKGCEIVEIGAIVKIQKSIRRLNNKNVYYANK